MDALSPRIAAIILAGGMSRRMGNENKLLVKWRGKELVKYAWEAALKSKCSHIVLVGGYELSRVKKLLGDQPVNFQENLDFASGMASSVVAGISSLKPQEYDGAIIMLADMPLITVQIVDLLIEKFDASGRAKIIIAAEGQKRGNPVVWPVNYFDNLKILTGDRGAREILKSCAHDVQYVDVGQAACFDIDTPQDLQDSAP